MSPSLATCLTIPFIIWLLYRDRSRNPAVSSGLWVPTIWVAIAASKPVVFWLTPGASGADNAYLEGTPIDRNVTVALIVLAIGILARRRIDWGRLTAENKWLWALYLFACISLLWSDYPFVAFKRWIRDAGNVVMILVILSEEDPRNAIRTVFVRCAYVLIPLSILFIKYYPEVGVGYNFWTGQAFFRGATVDKNALGRLAMLSALFSVWSLDSQHSSGWLRKIRNGLPEALLLLMCLWILSKANSSTSVACLALGITIYTVTRVDWVRSNSRLLKSGAVAVILVALLSLAASELRGVVTKSLGRRPDLTDRTEIWQEVLDLKTNPFIGVGFASFWMTPSGIRLGERLQVGSAHNGYLETYLNLGLIGVGLLLTVLISAMRNALHELTADSDRGPLYATLLMIGIIYNLSEVAFNNTSSVGFFVWLVAIYYPIDADVGVSAEIADAVV
jgi:exopolysaccharide production protein ExoQ